MTPFPPAFLDRPIAHRGLHGPGVPENSRAAIRAGIEGGWGIEIDLQPAADGTPMVFHDEDLARLTGEEGPILARPPADLARLRLLGTAEGIPTFAEVLALVAGRVPLLVEIKDQDGALGARVGALEEAAARVARGYAGPLAFMSFNPHAVIALRDLAPEVPRGLTTCGFAPADWPGVPEATLARLRGLPDVEAAGAGFVSHDRADLANPRLASLRAQGTAILAWTIRSAAEEAEARRVAGNVTFEGYLPGRAA